MDDTSENDIETSEVIELDRHVRISELTLLPVSRAARLMAVDKSELHHAMDVYVQTNGRDGIAYIERGSGRRLIRAGAIREYLVNQERKVLFG